MNSAPLMQQHPAELAPLLDLYRDLAPQRVLEIGVHQGGTLYHWATNAPSSALIVAVDTNLQYLDRDQDWAPDGITIVTVPGDSTDVLTAEIVARFAPYDFVFIDADHHLDAVRTDWLTYSKLTRPGGIIALHDILPADEPDIEVDLLWAELKEQYNTVEYTVDRGIGVVFMPVADRMVEPKNGASFNRGVGT